MSVEITRIGTGRPADITKLLTDPNSDFYYAAGKDGNKTKRPETKDLTPDSPLVKKLLVLAEGGNTIYPDNFNTRTPAELPITAEELRSLGRTTDTLALWIGVKDSEGKEVNLPPSEFNAWQGTVKPIGDLGATPAPDQPIDSWALVRKVQLQDRGPTYSVGDLAQGGQEFHIESPVGSKRLVAGGRIMTREYSINYGSENIIDADKTSPTFGHPIVVGNDGALDVNIPSETLKEIAAGKPYYGPVQIKMRMEDDARSDPKVFFLSDPAEAIRAESQNWQEENRTPRSDVRGVHFDPPIELQDGLFNSMEKEKTGYVALSGAQYQAWKYAMSEDKSARLKPVDDWFKDAFGSREQFDAAFPQSQFPDGKPLSREAYHAAVINAAARNFANADIAIWKSDTVGIDKDPNFVEASDKLFFKDETKLPADQLPRNKAAIADWLTAPTDVKAIKDLQGVYNGLNDEQRGKADAYLGLSVDTRAAKDNALAVAGEDVTKAIQKPIDEAGEKGKLDSIKVDDVVNKAVISGAARAFIAADVAIWKSETDKIDKNPNFMGASDALFFEEKTKLSSDQLPRDKSQIAAWMKGKPELQKMYDDLDKTQKAQADTYLELSVDTRTAKDHLTEVAGPAATKAIQAPIDKAGAEGKFDVIHADELVEKATHARLTIKGANPNVAAWQEAMTEYAAKHDKAPIAVDGAWGKKTEKLYEALGGDDRKVLNKLKMDGITLHPEHFEVAPPASTPPGEVRQPAAAVTK